MKVQKKWFPVEFQYVFPPFGLQYLITDLPLSIQHIAVLSAVKWLGAVLSQRPFLSFIQAVFYLGLRSRGSLYVSLFRSTSLLLPMVNKLKNCWTFNLKKDMQCSSHSHFFVSLNVVHFNFHHSSWLYIELPLSTPSQAPRHTGVLISP